jgi:ketosteroid isomerase-like protein
MSQENVEVVRRGLEAALRSPPDWDTVTAIFDPEHEFVSLVTRVEGASDIGVEGWRNWRARMDDAGDWTFAVEDVRPASGGQVLVLGRFRLRGERSGAEFETLRGIVCQVRDGRIVRTEVLPTPEEALKAAGASE